VLDTSGGGCTLATIPDPKSKFGGVIKMVNGGTLPVTIYQRGGFWQKSLGVGASNGSVRMHAAGSYLSACVPGQWQAPIQVLPTAPARPATNSFRVTWADNAALAGWRYGVQYRIGQGVWKQWKAGTGLKSAIFNGANAKTYFFRARTIRPVTNQKTDWSPPRRVAT